MKIQSLAALVAIVIASGCSKKTEVKPQATAPKPIEVRTASVELRHTDQTLSISGALVADESVSLSSEVPGRVQTIRYDFGQTVEKGAVVAQLDDTEYRLQLDQARASLAQARARLGITAEGASSPEETAAMKQARAQMEDARFKYQSAVQLVKSGDISQEHFTELQKAFGAREAAFEAARDEMRMNVANLSGLEAQIKMAEKKIRDCTIRAPFTGAVSEKLVSPGQYTKENTGIVTLVKTDPLRLRADLPEAGAGNVKQGSTLTFTSDAAPGASFHASVTELNPSLDSKSRTLTVEARLTQSDRRLRPGMFVQVRLVTARDAQVYVVPPDAVYRLAGLNKVFLIRDGKARQISIAAPQEIDGYIALPVKDLRPGDRVAVTNLPMLIDGAAVQVAAGA